VDANVVTFRRLARADFDLLSRWLAEPHVARWWHHDPSPDAVADDFGPTADGLEPAEDYIALAAGEPIGLIQFARFADYRDYRDELDDVYPVGDTCATIDYFIGDLQRISRGLGSAMISGFVEFIWDLHDDITHLVVPVNSDNTASCRALRKAGFRLVARGDLEPDSPDEGWSHDVFRRDRHGRVDADMVSRDRTSVAPSCGGSPR
jgi:aminoglycoside 6'-N-acetyltransferase